MTLLDAEQFDEARARRKRNLIVACVIAAIVLAWVAYHFRNYPERRAVERFFTALEHDNVEEAFAIWLRDPAWRQHSDRYAKYGYGDFYRDWGPSGDWGVIKAHKVNCSYSTGSGVIVEVTVNHRTEHAYVWVDKSDKTLHFSPNEVDCGNWWGWLTE
ncbi:MAG: hypothetical protein JO159_05095 [Acidobacteria bacterium]|nr:hypothetical protein [Acidobacteriota bacterium]MBV9622614.1 hypothetical protein [Acidobacteriota bacterium]